jgi:hypothetical protein
MRTADEIEAFATVKENDVPRHAGFDNAGIEVVPVA